MQGYLLSIFCNELGTNDWSGDMVVEFESATLIVAMLLSCRQNRQDILFF